MSRELSAACALMVALCPGTAFGQARTDPTVTTQQIYQKSLRDEIYGRTGVVATRSAIDAAVSSMDPPQAIANARPNDAPTPALRPRMPGSTGYIASARPRSFNPQGAQTEARPSEPVGSGAPSGSTSVRDWFAALVPGLRRLPTIVLTVSPSPPRDYRVEINGEECPATEQSQYKVAPGAIIVRVTRGGRPDCAWQGTVTADTIVKCEF